MYVCPHTPGTLACSLLAMRSRVNCTSSLGSSMSYTRVYLKRQQPQPHTSLLHCGMPAQRHRGQGTRASRTLTQTFGSCSESRASNRPTGPPQSSDLEACLWNQMAFNPCQKATLLSYAVYCKQVLYALLGRTTQPGVCSLAIHVYLLWQALVPHQGPSQRASSHLQQDSSISSIHQQCAV